MTELLEELEQKRQLHNVEAEKHRRIRDELNEKTKEWVEKRDSLNAQVRELVDQAAKHRESRDELNVKVREANVWNKVVNDLNEKVTKIKKDNLPKNNGPSVQKLKKELKSLEFKQMTSVLSKGKEQELIDQMAKLQAEIKERENLEKIEDIKGEKLNIEWGSQIRSYFFMPYQLVKDHRTGYETGNVTAVMDGDIDDFSHEYLKYKKNK